MSNNPLLMSNKIYQLFASRFLLINTTILISYLIMLLANKLISLNRLNKIIYSNTIKAHLGLIIKLSETLTISLNKK